MHVHVGWGRQHAHHKNKASISGSSPVEGLSLLPSLLVEAQNPKKLPAEPTPQLLVSSDQRHFDFVFIGTQKAAKVPGSSPGENASLLPLSPDETLSSEKLPAESIPHILFSSDQRHFLRFSWHTEEAGCLNWYRSSTGLHKHLVLGGSLGFPSMLMTSH